MNAKHYAALPKRRFNEIHQWIKKASEDELVEYIAIEKRELFNEYASDRLKAIKKEKRSKMHMDRLKSGDLPRHISEEAFAKMTKAIDMVHKNRVTVTEAAETCDVSPQTLWAFIKTYDIDVEHKDYVVHKASDINIKDFLPGGSRKVIS